MAADLETNPYDLKKMVNLSNSNPESIISGDRWLSKSSFKRYSFIKLIDSINGGSMVGQKVEVARQLIKV